MIITEYCSNGTLEDMLRNNPSKLDDTAKLIIIYGVANCLLYLHSHNIVHNCISTKNIILDDELHPKLFNFNSSKNIKNKDKESDKDDEEEIYFPEINIFERNGRYIPPEIYGRNKCSMSSDIYSFSIVVYEMLSGELAYSDIYELIDKKNKERLPTNKGNINDHLYEIISDQNSPQVFNINKYLNEHIGIDHVLNIDDYIKDQKLEQNNGSECFKIKHKENQGEFFGKEPINEYPKEVNILSKLDHPSILSFIGYSPRNFKNKPHPVIVTEFASCGTLEDAIELENNNLSKDGWNDTKKLINIYGIASSLQYLHSLNIIHRDLRPSNVLLDDSLFPKLADFGLSKEITDENIESKISSGFKGTPAYAAPEIWNNNKYTKACDVYAFAFTVFEIITSQKCFPDIKGFYDLYKQVVLNNKRPKFEYPIHDCYQKLIKDCWSANPENRPSFDEIIHELETNPDFITDCVDKDEFLDYVDMIHQKNNVNNDIPMKLKQNNEAEYCNESCKRKSYIERDKVSEIDSQNMKIDEKVTEDDV